MIIASLLAAVLSVPASAQATACTPNAMTAEWSKITFALWLTDYTIPDSSPRTSTLRYKSCSMGDEGEETRFYASDDGVFTVRTFTNNGGASGATTMTLQRNNEWVRLGTWRHHLVYYKGVGINQVAVPNGGGATMVKNVFVLPEGAIITPTTERTYGEATERTYGEATSR